jgi:hypothetical protein
MTETCDTCKRPKWDGGHGLNERECYADLNGADGQWICDAVARATKAEGLLREVVEDARSCITIDHMRRIGGLLEKP